MSHDLSELLVVGVASSALFDLTESDAYFREHGEDKYREYQEQHLDDTLKPGVAFPFIQRLLGLNGLDGGAKQLVEVIIMSRNDPGTGLRVMRSIESHGLGITRAIFMQGRAPYRFMDALSMSLFLSNSAADVQEAIAEGFAAGQVVGEPEASEDQDDARRALGSPSSDDLRVALDFDGVIAGDESERIMQAGGLEDFHRHEVAHASEPMSEGPLSAFLGGLNRIQDVEDRLVREAEAAGSSYNRRLHVAIVTARSAPSHERVIKHLRTKGLRVNDAFFLGGIDKSTVLGVLRPHLFFDDQQGHLELTQRVVPSVHVPFGITNLPGQARQDVGEVTDPPEQALQGGGEVTDSPEQAPQGWGEVTDQPEQSSQGWGEVTNQPEQAPQGWAEVTGQPGSAPQGWGEVTNPPQQTQPGWDDQH